MTALEDESWDGGTPRIAVSLWMRGKRVQVWGAVGAVLVAPLKGFRVWNRVGFGDDV